MLLGVVLGIIITLLLFTVVFLTGQNRAYKGQIVQLGVEQAKADAEVRKLAGQVQTMKQPIEIKLEQQQVITLAHMIITAVERIQQSLLEKVAN